jgi:hypothetical protein
LLQDPEVVEAVEKLKALKDEFVAVQARYAAARVEAVTDTHMSTMEDSTSSEEER